MFWVFFFYIFTVKLKSEPNVEVNSLQPLYWEDEVKQDSEWAVEGGRIEIKSVVLLTNKFYCLQDKQLVFDYHYSNSGLLQQSLVIELLVAQLVRASTPAVCRTWGHRFEPCPTRPPTLHCMSRSHHSSVSSLYRHIANDMDRTMYQPKQIEHSYFMKRALVHKGYVESVSYRVKQI